MFVDASVMTSMMTDEVAAREYADRMRVSTVRMTSPMAIAKTASDVASRLGLSLGDAAQAVRTFAQLMNIQIVAVPPKAGFLAVAAEASFGMGRHTAALGREDCMTYACARYYRQPLLFRDGGFGSTDIEVV